MDTAKTWYHSPEYQEIVRLRTEDTINDLILVEPVGPDFTTAEWAQQIRALAAGSDGAAEPIGHAAD
jgi:uncharacterized protein DUF1330